jgi:hypothetical protein
MKRIYTTEEYNGAVRQVVLSETYHGSHHWNVEITPEGYGSAPEVITTCRIDEDGYPSRDEGYGNLRIELAHHIARSLTGAVEYEAVYPDGRSETVQLRV